MKGGIKPNKFIDINTGQPRKKNRKQKRLERKNRKESLINLPSSSVSVPKIPTAKPTKSSIRQAKKIARSNLMELQKAKQREKAFKRELSQAMENDRRTNEERYKRKAEQRKREEQEREERQRVERQRVEQQYDSIDYTTVALLNFRSEIAGFPDGIAEPCLAIMDNLQQTFGDEAVAMALYNMNTRFYEIVQRNHFDSDSVSRDLESSILASIKEIIPEDSWQELGIEWSELEQAFDEAESGYDV